MLIGLLRVVGDPREVDLGQHLAHGDQLVAIGSQRQHLEDACLEQPDLADLEPPVDIQLVDRPMGDDDLDRDLRNRAISAARVALVRLQAALVLLLAERLTCLCQRG